MTSTVRGARRQRDGRAGSRARAKSGKYRIVTDYFTDPGRNTRADERQLVAVARGAEADLAALRPLRPDRQRQRRRRQRATAAPTRRSPTPRPATRSSVASDTEHGDQRRQPRLRPAGYAALDGPFAEVTSGFAGTASDGLDQLDAVALADHDRTTRPSNGNVVQTARVDRRHDARQTATSFTLALGFGATQAAAVGDGRGVADARRSSRSSNDYETGLGALRRGAQRAAEEAARDQPNARRRARATRTT